MVPGSVCACMHASPIHVFYGERYFIIIQQTSVTLGTTIVTRTSVLLRKTMVNTLASKQRATQAAISDLHPRTPT